MGRVEKRSCDSIVRTEAVACYMMESRSPVAIQCTLAAIATQGWGSASELGLCFVKQVAYSDDACSADSLMP